MELEGRGQRHPFSSSHDHACFGSLLKIHCDSLHRFHHLRLPQISCSEGKAVQVVSVLLGGLGGLRGDGGAGGGGGGRGDFVLLTSNRFLTIKGLRGRDFVLLTPRGTSCFSV